MQIIDASFMCKELEAFETMLDVLGQFWKTIWVEGLPVRCIWSALSFDDLPKARLLLGKSTSKMRSTARLVILESGFCSGPGQTNEMELDAGSMEKLLEFLEHSFSGGTDLNAPLQLSLGRLEQHGWELVCTMHKCHRAFNIHLVTHSMPASDFLKLHAEVQISAEVVGSFSQAA